MIQVLLCYSCGVDRVYTSGTYGSLKSYTAKPVYNGEKTSKYYVSGDLSFGKHEQDGGDFKDSKTIVTVNAHKAITRKNFNLHYGVGGSYGNYKFHESYEGAVSENEKQHFYSANFKTGINYTMSRPKIDFRFIGLELTYNYEFGPYQDKLSELRSVLNGDNVVIVNEKSMFSYNLYSEYVFKLDDKSSFNLGFYGGYIFVDSELVSSGDATFSGLTIGLNVDRYTFSMIFESGYGGVKSSKFGLAYRL